MAFLSRTSYRRFDSPDPWWLRQVPAELRDVFVFLSSSGSQPTSYSPSAAGPACALHFIEWKVTANIGGPFPRVNSMFCKERQRQPIETKRHATGMHRGAILRAQ